MSILRTYNVQNPDSAATNIQLSADGGIAVAGIVTATGGLTVGAGASVYSPATNVLSLGTNNTEKVRIDSSGNFNLVNTAGIMTAFKYETPALINNHFKSQSTTAGAYVRMYAAASSGQWDIYGNGANLRFSDNASSGNIQMDRPLSMNSQNIIMSSGYGIDFSATSNSAGMTSELLSDYEQGTWTPSVGGNATYNFQGGSYVKVGSKVTAWFDISISTIGTGSQTTISGLPYSCANISSNTYPQGHPGCIGYFTGLALNLTSINIRVDPGNAFFYVTGPTAATTTSGSTQNAMTSGTRFVGALIYVSA